MRRTISLVMLALALATAPAMAQPGARLKQKQQKQLKQQDAIERFLNMPPEQQRQMLQQLPPDRRRQLQRTLQALELLSPEERDLLRGRTQRFAAFPQDRRPAIRAELRYLRGLKPEDRQRRMSADDFRQQWSPEELQFLQEVGGQQDARGKQREE
jgi:hypothetical protein